MPLTKEQKRKNIEELKEKIDRQKIAIFVNFRGIKVKDLTDLRKKLKKADSELKIVKKTLARIAFKDRGLEADVEKLQGEIALVLGYQDVISSAKTVWQFASLNPNLKILGGFLENKLIEAEKIIELAELPDRSELLAKLVGSIASPISNLLNALEYNIKGLLRVLAKAKT